MGNSVTSYPLLIKKRAYDLKNPYLGKIVVNKELHSEGSDRSCRHLEIEVGNAIK
jgi:sulfite reductase alpha subunit-like flavoprotein